MDEDCVWYSFGTYLKISMVDGEYFKKLEAVARSVKGNDRPFGGIQLIFTGDFLQVALALRNTWECFTCFDKLSLDENI